MDDPKQLTVESIKQHEGYRGEPYLDSNGHFSVGYGRNFNAYPYTRQEALDFTNLAVDDIFKKLSYNFTFASVSPIRQAVLAEMTYQLGIEGVSEFKNMWEALAKKDYILAATAIRNSKLSQQAPLRTESYAYRMQNDVLETQ